MWSKALHRATDLRDTKASEVVSLEEEVSRLRVEVSVPTPTLSLQGEEDDGDGPVVEGLGDQVTTWNKMMNPCLMSTWHLVLPGRSFDEGRMILPLPSPPHFRFDGGHCGSLGRDVGHVGYGCSFG